MPTPLLKLKPIHHKPRQCDTCGATYHRCNKYRAWVQQAPGSRTGWLLREKTMCTKCQDASDSVRAMMIFEARVTRVKR